MYVIKDAQSYLRFDKDGHRHCALEQATVFAEDCLDQARERIFALQRLGIHEAAVYVLTITEEPYQGEMP